MAIAMSTARSRTYCIFFRSGAMHSCRPSWTTSPISPSSAANSRGVPRATLAATPAYSFGYFTKRRPRRNDKPANTRPYRRQYRVLWIMGAKQATLTATTSRKGRGCPTTSGLSVSKNSFTGSAETVVRRYKNGCRTRSGGPTGPQTLLCYNTRCLCARLSPYQNR